MSPGIRFVTHCKRYLTGGWQPNPFPTIHVSPSERSVEIFWKQLASPGELLM